MDSSDKLVESVCSLSSVNPSDCLLDKYMDALSGTKLELLAPHSSIDRIISNSYDYLTSSTNQLFPRRANPCISSDNLLDVKDAPFPGRKNMALFKYLNDILLEEQHLKDLSDNLRSEADKAVSLLDDENSLKTFSPKTKDYDNDTCDRLSSIRTDECLLDITPLVTSIETNSMVLTQADSNLNDCDTESPEEKPRECVSSSSSTSSGTVPSELVGDKCEADELDIHSTQANKDSDFETMTSRTKPSVVDLIESDSEVEVILTPMSNPSNRKSKKFYRKKPHNRGTKSESKLVSPTLCHLFKTRLALNKEYIRLNPEKIMEDSGPLYRIVFQNDLILKFGLNQFLEVLRENNIMIKDVAGICRGEQRNTVELYFNDKETRDRLGRTGIHVNGVNAGEPQDILASRYAKVIITGIGLSVPTERVKNHFKLFGEVLSHRFMSYRDHPTILAGPRQLYMLMYRDIPERGHFQYLDIETFASVSVNYSVTYPGMPRSCHSCGSKSHVIGECPTVLCKRCHKPGHTVSSCPTVLFCTKCYTAGHTDMDCCKKNLLPTNLWPFL